MSLEKNVKIYAANKPANNIITIFLLNLEIKYENKDAAKTVSTAPVNI